MLDVPAPRDSNGQILVGVEANQYHTQFALKLVERDFSQE